MDNPQYIGDYVMVTRDPIQSFKPYYKWITLNTKGRKNGNWVYWKGVLNLIING